MKYEGHVVSPAARRQRRRTLRAPHVLPPVFVMRRADAPTRTLTRDNTRSPFD